MTDNDSIDRVTSLPTLTPGDVHVWQADLDAIADAETLLAAEEKERAARFHFARDRHRFAAGRSLLRRLLARYLQCPPGDISFTYGRRGKPAVADPARQPVLEFNVSHSAGVGVFAFSHDVSVGIDIERVRADVDVSGIAGRFFSTSEAAAIAALPKAERRAAFFRCWTRKEAFIKGRGDGLFLGLDRFDVSVDDAARLLACRVPGVAPDRWTLSTVHAPAGFAAALAVGAPAARVLLFHVR